MATQIQEVEVPIHWSQTSLHVRSAEDLLRPVEETHVRVGLEHLVIQTPVDCAVVSLPSKDQYPIEHGHELPPPTRRGRCMRRNKATRFPFEHMQPGDSFFVPCPSHRTPRSIQASLADTLRKQYQLYSRYFTSRTKNNGVRVWCVPEWYYQMQFKHQDQLDQ